VNTFGIIFGALFFGPPLPVRLPDLEAAERARAELEEWAQSAPLDDPTYLQILLTRPPDQASWRDLQTLAERDPGLALKFWDDMREAARWELRSKQRAGKALEGYAASPWDRAQFLALCQELADGWQPRNGIERQLLDNLAVAQTALLTWLSRLANWSTRPMKKDMSEGAGWEPPRLTEAEAVEEAMGMVERFQKIFTRTLRALCDLRRRPLAVVVQQAGQVNIAEQQVNVAGQDAAKAIEQIRGTACALPGGSRDDLGQERRRGSRR
jgi:hypothetical protein